MNGSYLAGFVPTLEQGFRRGLVTRNLEIPMKRTFAIFGAAAVLALLVVFGLTQTGMIDKNKSVTSIPAGAVPHGGAEKPVSDLVPGSAPKN
jgi:hypothetical protein